MIALLLPLLTVVGLAPQIGRITNPSLAGASAPATQTVLHTFTHVRNAYLPAAGLIADSRGNLYGVAEEGGQYEQGSIFKVTPSGRITVIHSFRYEDGDTPSDRIMIASDGRIYGTVRYGEIGYAGQDQNPGGLVFSLRTDGSAYKVLYRFDWRPGFKPDSALVQGPNGTLYGATSGQVGPTAVIYALKSNGSGFRVLWRAPDKDGPLNAPTPIAVVANRLYGISQNGNGDGGAVFELGLDGSGPIVLHRFQHEGAVPTMVVAAGGTIYGTYTGDGVPGCVFRLSTRTRRFTVLHTFNSSDGGEPNRPLLITASHTIYGTTSDGGARGGGSIFRINADGTGFRSLYSFAQNVAVEDGWEPTLLRLANGQLYGTAHSIDYPNCIGFVFRIGVRGDGYRVVTPLYSPGSGPAEITAPVIRTASGSFIGASSNGGKYDAGTVFKMSSSGSVVMLHEFEGPEGSNPNCGPILGRDGRLYGTTQQRGPHSSGTIYSLRPDGKSFRVVHAFTVGSQLNRMPLFEGRDGKLYGVTDGNAQGGTVFASTLYSVFKDGTDFRILHRFQSNAEITIPGPLRQLGDGDLCDCTLRMSNDAMSGDIFTVHPDGTGFRVIHGGKAQPGFVPGFAILLARDGLLYGIGSESPESVAGITHLVLYRLAPDGSRFQSLHTEPRSCASSGALIQGNDGRFYGKSVSGVFDLLPDGTRYELLNSGRLDGVEYSGADSVTFAQNGTIFVVTSYSIVKLNIASRR